MGYAQTTHWGHPYEINAGFGVGIPITTVVVADWNIGGGQIPTYADLDKGEVIGAYCDVCIPSFVNSFAGSNWLRADAGYPTVSVVPIGHSKIEAISDMTLACYSDPAGTYPYNWIYGDTNFASIFSSPTSHYFGHNCYFYLSNVRANSTGIFINNFIFRFRFYVR
jgi:hypothetical protein